MTLTYLRYCWTQVNFAGVPAANTCDGSWWRRRLFPFRKQAKPFLTVDAIIGNQAFSWMMHMWTADMKSNEEWSSQLWSQSLQLRKEAWKKFRTSTGLEPVTFKPPWVQAPLKSWIFFRLLYAIAKIAIITARIILHLISYPQFTYDLFHMHHSPTYLSREHMNPKLTCSQRQWLHSSVG